MTKKDKAVLVRMPSPLHRKLKLSADKANRSVSGQVRHAIEKLLEETAA